MTHFHSQQFCLVCARRASDLAKQRQIQMASATQCVKKNENERYAHCAANEEHNKSFNSLGVYALFGDSFRSFSGVCHIQNPNRKLQPFRCYSGDLQMVTQLKISLNDANYEPKKKKENTVGTIQCTLTETSTNELNTSAEKPATTSTTKEKKTNNQN